jgi:pimeloyl-ACP methyl ester carboxylesterase
MPGVVLIHGAWHGAWAWREVVAELRRERIPVSAVELPFTGFTDDVAAARSAIDAAGPGAVMCAHSYGGVVMTQAASGRGDVRRLVYLAAFLLDTGEHLSQVLAAGNSRLLSALTVDERGVSVDPARAGEILYGDSPSSVDRVVPLLRPMPAEGDPPIVTGVPAWRHTPSTYVVCTNDEAIPPYAQRAMAARADEVVEWPTDHSPFLTRSSAIAALLAGYL